MFRLLFRLFPKHVAIVEIPFQQHPAAVPLADRPEGSDARADPRTCSLVVLTEPASPQALFDSALRTPHIHSLKHSLELLKKWGSPEGDLARPP